MKRKTITWILSILMCISLISPLAVYANTLSETFTKTTEKKTEESSMESTESMKTSDQTTEENLSVSSNSKLRSSEPFHTTDCYISGLKIKTSTDGTEPFDSDDEAGNDSSEKNGIVRTFDYINYSLEYTTALTDETHVVDTADVLIEFVLEQDPREAEFNIETLNWCLEQKITYFYEDGSSSTTWDKTKTVIKQVLTGFRHLENTQDYNAIPGAGTLSVGIYVKAAKNGEEISPSFSLKIKGDAEENSITADKVVVSAAPRYDIMLSRNTATDKLGYFDPDSGEIYNADAEGLIQGRMEGYGIALALKNTSVNKGLRGIELPEGDITFDVTISSKVNGSDATFSDDYAPLFWDYHDINQSNATTRGKLNRLMTIRGDWPSSCTWQLYPYNNVNHTALSSVNEECYCQGGGKLTMIQDAAKKNKYHVTMSGYSFDWDDFTFPVRTPSSISGTMTYKQDTGIFSVGYFEVIAPFPREVAATTDVFLDVECSNIKATSISGIDVTEEQALSNNKSSVKITLYAPGTINKYCQFASVTNGRNNSVWNAGDSYGPANTTCRVQNMLSYTGDTALRSVNILYKFDDEAFEVPEGTSKYTSLSYTASVQTIGPINTLFAAKPDRTGWESDSEMDKTREEQLIYFDSIDELNAAGYICVGILYEVRDSYIYGQRDAVLYIYQNMHVKDTAVAGQVYQITNDIRAWRTDGDVMSWSSMTYDPAINAYGLGRMDWVDKTYIDGYTKPSANIVYNYVKTQYTDGTISGGHTGGVRYGDSLLIVGAKTGIKISVSDKSGSATKSIYDLDAAERTVNYTIKSSLSAYSQNGEVSGTGQISDVVVTATLPYDLTYVTGSSNLSPDSITVNEDGTSTIVWTIANCQVGKDIPEITLQCIIGHAGTKNDVHNNDAITIEAKITSPLDSRKNSIANGTISTTTIHVVKLAASSISKSVQNPLIELGEENRWELHFGNNSDEIIENASLVDILPYNGDGRGSNFTGSYQIKTICIDYSAAPKWYADSADTSFLAYTTDVSIRNSSSLFDNDSWLSGVITQKTNDKNQIKYENLSLEDVTALYFHAGNLPENEYLTIYITVSFVDENGNLIEDIDGQKQLPGDQYSNTFSEYADNQAAVVNSNVVNFQVVQRNLSGTAWLDEVIDGERDDNEKRISGFLATLYRTDAYNTTDIVSIPGIKKNLYEAYDIFGKKVQPVVTDNDGNYCFDNLPSGNYYVVFTGTEGYGVTKYQNCSDTNIDSDGKAAVSSIPKTYEELKNALSAAFIADIELPSTENMYDYRYLSEHNDSGFTVLPEPSQAIAKLANKTTGSNLDSHIGRYTGIKKPGYYINGENVSFLLRITNTGNCLLKDIYINDDISGIEKYISDFSYQAKIGDCLKTISGKPIYVLDIKDVDPIYTIVLDQLDIGDSVEIECSAVIQNTSELIEGLKNTVFLNSSFEWSIDQFETTYTCETPDTIVDNKNYSEDYDLINLSAQGTITVVKYDNDGNTPLRGVTFKLTGENGFEQIMSTDNDGKIIFTELQPQKYTLTEIATLEGYSLMQDNIIISLPLALSQKEAEDQKANISKGYFSVTDNVWYFYHLTYEIKNNSLFSTPATGGSNTELYIGMVIAFIMIGWALVMLNKKKKRMLFK